MKAEWFKPLPLFSLRIELSLENEHGFWREVLKSVEGRGDAHRQELSLAGAPPRAPTHTL
jgi:hypothetical protein